jgi:hypothetical protein
MKETGKDWRRGRARTVVQIIGVTTMLVGGGALPVGWGASPKRDLSAFNNAADLGAFVKPGVVLIGAGLLVLLVSFLLPRSRIDG